MGIALKVAPGGHHVHHRQLKAHLPADLGPAADQPLPQVFCQVTTPGTRAESIALTLPLSASGRRGVDNDIPWLLTRTRCPARQSGRGRWASQ